ncbi:hypothetical protein HYY27_06670 [bacterium]|nr:hypothetical protein [bacterium]
MALKALANYYQNFDADFSLDVPAEGFGGWKKAEVELTEAHTAVAVMHAWDCGTREQYPGLYHAVEEVPRANEVCRTVFPGLLSAVRASRLKLFHIVGGGDYYKSYPEYKRVVALAGPGPGPPERVEPDSALERLRRFKRERSYVGAHNAEDAERACRNLNFAPEAVPQEGEGIAENGHQLFALCREAGVNHLIYAGFAINWCILLSPGGMAEMQRHGAMCSALRQATTAVENKETARKELCKEIALWRVALAFGFVFDVDDFVRAISRPGARL